MHPIIYDVAVSIDGYISAPSGDVSRFAHDGPVVDDYLARLASYSVAIMGRKTYEFGYGFGLKPGQNPYRHMKTYVFSKSLTCPPDSEITVLETSTNRDIELIRAQAQGPVYLCGGGAFAGDLLKSGHIDRIRLKRAPIILGGGIRLFGSVEAHPDLTLLECKNYKNGYIFQDFRL